MLLHLSETWMLPLATPAWRAVSNPNEQTASNRARQTVRNNVSHLKGLFRGWAKKTERIWHCFESTRLSYRYGSMVVGMYRHCTVSGNKSVGKTGLQSSIGDWPFAGLDTLDFLYD